jgi:hypothetical protein
VPTDNSGHWQIVDSSYITEPQATSDIPAGLSDPVGSTFIQGEVKEVDNTTGSIPLDACEYTEIEFVIQATGNATNSGDYCFQLYDTTNNKTLSYSKYAEVSLADGTFSYRKPITFPAANVGTSCSPYTDQVSATADTTVPLVDTLVSGMTITPGAGDYLVSFTGSVENAVTSYNYISLYVNGVQVPHTEREMRVESSIPGTSFPVAFQALVTGVGASDAIEVRARTTVGTATIHERTLTVQSVDTADVSQATATADAPETSATDILLPGMTLTPGAGDYLVWFSGSAEESSGGSDVFASLYVNGVQVAHTERMIDGESSIAATSFPIMFQARVTGVGASDAIEVRWRIEGGGTATMHQRTLTVQSITPVDVSEASATADATIATGGTNVLVPGMTLTPGAGDYLVWFSGSISNSNTNDLTELVSLYVNGSQVGHTEREIFVENSLDGENSFPVALHAYVTGVGASDVIEVRGRTSLATATIHERTLVVSKVVATDLSDFPVLISITDTDLLDEARSDGNDIVFRWDDGTCGGKPCKGLYHEIEEWNSSTGELVAWVKIPTLSSSNDTTIYMYYGNPNVSVPSENPAGVWDSNYSGVYHLNQNPGGAAPQMLDSTLNVNHGTAMGGSGGVTRVQSATGAGNPNATATFSATPTAGNLLIAK